MPETDPSWPSVGRGYFAIMSRFIDQASALPDDRDVDLTVNNVRRGAHAGAHWRRGHCTVCDRLRVFYRHRAILCAA